MCNNYKVDDLIVYGSKPNFSYGVVTKIEGRKVWALYENMTTAEWCWDYDRSLRKAEEKVGGMSKKLHDALITVSEIAIEEENYGVASSILNIIQNQLLKFGKV